MKNEAPGLPTTAPARAWALVADEHALIRGGLKMLLSESIGSLGFIEVIDGQTLLRAGRSQVNLALAVIDLNLPHLHGGAALVEFSRLRPALPLIIVSGLHSPEMVRRALALPNVHAVVSKSADLREMRTAIAAAMRGERAAVPVEPALPRRLGKLTPRQGDVHRLLCEGLSNKSIAALLGISTGTVKNHVSEIFRALNTTNRTQAARRLRDPR